MHKRPGATQSATRSAQPRQEFLTGQNSGEPTRRTAPARYHVPPEQSDCAYRRYHHAQSRHRGDGRVGQHSSHQRLMMGDRRAFYVRVIAVDPELATQRTHQDMRRMGYSRLMPHLGVSKNEHPHRDCGYRSS